MHEHLHSIANPVLPHHCTYQHAESLSIIQTAPDYNLHHGAVHQGLTELVIEEKIQRSCHR